MKRDFSTELKDFLEEHAQKNGLDLKFQCQKDFNIYRIKVIDPSGNSEEKEIDQAVVSDYLENHNLSSKKEILEITFNPGPRVTFTPRL